MTPRGHSFVAPARITRRESRLRDQMIESVYHGRVQEAARRAQKLADFLGQRAYDDDDLAIVCGWLEEQYAGGKAPAWEAPARIKLLLTALPLVFACGLTALLAWVLVWG